MLHIFTKDLYDEFYCHNAPRLENVMRSGYFASEFHDQNLDYDDYENNRGTWEIPNWMNINCPLQTVVKLQFPTEGMFVMLSLTFAHLRGDALTPNKICV